MPKGHCKRMGKKHNTKLCFFTSNIFTVLIMDVILWRAGLAKIHSGVPGYVLQTNIHTEIGTGTRTEA